MFYVVYLGNIMSNLWPSSSCVFMYTKIRYLIEFMDGEFLSLYSPYNTSNLAMPSLWMSIFLCELHRLNVKLILLYRIASLLAFYILSYYGSVRPV